MGFGIFLFYPFGMAMDGFSQNYATTGATNRYTYNGKELNGDLGLDMHDYGARWYDASIGRFSAIDGFASDFSDKSPYHYASNNPIRFIDINGDSTYLLIWATNAGEIGHSGIAIENYDTQGNSTGTYIYFDFWPGNPKGVGKTNFSEDVEATYHEQPINSREELLDFTVNGLEAHSADGILGFDTNQEEDIETGEKALESMESNSTYNGVNCNCADFAAEVLEFATNQLIDASEQIEQYRATTPNQLYKASSQIDGAKVIRNPGKKVKNNYIKGIIGTGRISQIARKKVKKQ